MNLKKVLCAALSTVTAVSLLASCGGKGKMQMDKAELTEIGRASCRERV